MKVTRGQSKYPYYGKSDNGNVVCFTSPSTGVLVWRTNHLEKLGSELHGVNENFFTPTPNPFEEEKFVPITITLETMEEVINMSYALSSTIGLNEMSRSFNELFDPTK